MTRNIKKTPFLLVILITCFAFLAGCGGNGESDKPLKFAVSAEYPPFEYQKHGELIGFDIDLARLIAKKLNKKVVFEDMQFSSILPALASGRVDAAISTITITPERQKNFDFSNPYYVDSLATVFKKGFSVTQETQLQGKKVACQLGTTMEIWLKKHIPAENITAMDTNNQSIEALKAGHVNVVLMDSMQAQIFSQKNDGLSYQVIGNADNGYGIAVKKGSELKDKINSAIAALQANGEIKKLQQKWLNGA